MSITHGMQVEEIEKIGRELQQRFSPAVAQVIADIERAVNDTTVQWVGPDAERFRSWWPEKRSRLRAMADELAAYGQIAAENAAAQRQVSDTGAGGVSWLGGPNALASGGGELHPGPRFHSDPNLVQQFGDGLRRANDGTWLIGPFVSTFDAVGDHLDMPIPGYGPADKLLSGFGYFTEGFSIAEQLGRGEYVDAGLDAAFVGGDLAADALKATPTVHSYLAGVGVQYAAEVGRLATEIDWSMDGLRMVRDASLSDWAEVFPDTLFKTGQTVLKVVAP